MIHVLMCCSSLSVKGGMVSVVKNYLNCDWGGQINIHYIPTHIESGKIVQIAYFFVAYCKILWLTLTGRVDIAHLHVAERGSFYRKAIILRTLKCFGKKVILHHHGAEFELFYNGLSDKKKQYVDRILGLADVNIVLSQRLVPMITSKAANARVEVLYNAVNVPSENPYNPNADGILFLGRLGTRKGTYDLLEAVKRIDTELPGGIKFFLCGDGEVDAVKGKIHELGIAHRISHVGWTDGHQKASFMKQSIVNVLPSYNEGLPMTILETMAQGIPNISTAIASIPEIIEDGVNGYLIKPGDIDELCRHLLKLVKDADLRLKFSRSSYDLIKDSFSLDKNICNLKDIYYSLSE